MATIALIHGMWSRPHVWNNLRGSLEQRGHRVVVPTLAHHRVAPGDPPPPDLATASVRDYCEGVLRDLGRLGIRDDYALVGHSMGSVIAQLVAERRPPRAFVGLASAPPGNIFALSPAPLRLFARQLATWGFWRKSHRPTYKAARWGVLHGIPEDEARAVYDTFVHESGRALFELGLGFLDPRRGAHVAPNRGRTPMLFMTGTLDRTTPESVGRRTAALHSAQFEALEGHGHWLLGEPGWQVVADKTAGFVERYCP